MKENMNLIHRDVKPSNILLNRQGEMKLCDFGISGHLTNSVAKTVNAGCKPYMPPERIEGDTKDAYGVQADVWSLGITLVCVMECTIGFINSILDRNSFWSSSLRTLENTIRAAETSCARTAAEN